MADHMVEALAALADRIEERKDAGPEVSYTAKLLEEGVEKCAKKLGEESVELILAAMSSKADHVRSEAADVLYHLLVLLQATGVPLRSVMSELDARTRYTGIEEKLSRRQL